MSAAFLLRAPREAARRALGAARAVWAVRPAPAGVLLYHRVAEPDLDPWGLCVSPAHFVEQLSVLRRHGPVVPLAELADGLRRGRVPRAWAVTFDDGYADNVHAALPLLEAHGVPATFFLTTGDGGREREFWWDELERLFLQPTPLPQRLVLEIGTETVDRDLGDAADPDGAEWPRHRAWRAWEPPPTARHAAYLDLWERLIGCPAAEQRAALDAVLVWSGQEPVVRPTHRSVSWDEAAAAERSGLVTVGAHTVTHPALPALAPNDQQAEMGESRRALESLLGHPVRTCAYPYGRHDADTLAAARAAGFESAVTTEARGLRPGDDAFAIPRSAVADVGARAFRQFLAREARS